MPEAIAEASYRRLIADESLPFAHRVLWAILWDGDLRLDDLLSLDVRDADLDARTVRVDYPAKGAGPQVAQLSPNAVLLLRMLIDGRTDGPLFTDDSGGPLGRETAVRQAQQVGVSIHAFRLGGQIHGTQTSAPPPS